MFIALLVLSSWDTELHSFALLEKMEKNKKSLVLNSNSSIFMKILLLIMFVFDVEIQLGVLGL